MWGFEQKFSWPPIWGNPDSWLLLCASKRHSSPWPTLRNNEFPLFLRQYIQMGDSSNYQVERGEIWSSRGKHLNMLINCQVTAMTKEKTALVIPNAIQICTNSEKLFFTSFAARDKTHMMLFRLVTEQQNMSLHYLVLQAVAECTSWLPSNPDRDLVLGTVCIWGAHQQVGITKHYTVNNTGNIIQPCSLGLYSILQSGCKVCADTLHYYLDKSQCRFIDTSVFSIIYGVP